MANEVEAVTDGDGPEELVPVTVAGQRVYVSARRLQSQAFVGDEVEISSRHSTLDQALEGLARIAQELGVKLQNTGASKVNVEFGCEFAVESGTLIAVVGKVNAKSAFKVGLEWANP